MANKITQNPGDVILNLSEDEYRALVALLSEISDEAYLNDLCHREEFEISSQQCNRLAALWSHLVQNKR